jgi:hypothetical protein
MVLLALLIWSKLGACEERDMPKPDSGPTLEDVKTVKRKNLIADERLATLEYPEIKPENLVKLRESMAHAYDPVRYEKIKKAAARHGLKPDELARLTIVELRQEPNRDHPATNPESGASGPFQIRPDIRDEFQNKAIKDKYLREADTAAAFLADLKKRNTGVSDKFHLAAYNYGEGNIRENASPMMKFPQETINYIVYDDEVKKMQAQRRAGKLAENEKRIASSAQATQELTEKQAAEAVPAKMRDAFDYLTGKTE